MREEVTHDISRLNEERVIPTSTFREVEVFEAISQMEHDKWFSTLVLPKVYGC
jgi:hypothetical protein